MNILDEWINDYYLSDAGVEDIRQSIYAKPSAKYAVLDNFFKINKIEELILHHASLSFNEAMDRRAHETGEWLPYDGAVVFAKPGVHFGSDLFFDKEWHQY